MCIEISDWLVPRAGRKKDPDMAFERKQAERFEVKKVGRDAEMYC